MVSRLPLQGGNHHRDRPGLLCGRRPQSVSVLTRHLSGYIKWLLTFGICRWNTKQQGGQSDEQERIASSPHGFGSISRRVSSKPILAAVNGGAFGGGVEMVMNCDLVIASDEAVFALAEVKRGVIAAQGGVHHDSCAPRSYQKI